MTLRSTILLLATIVPLLASACGPGTQGGGGDAASGSPGPEGSAGVTPTPAVAPTVSPTGQPTSQVRSDVATGLSVNSRSIPTARGAYIGGINAFCQPADTGHTRPGGNLSPHVDWQNVPPGTKSFALLAWDPDTPMGSPKAGVEGEVVPMDEPRSDFFHWVLVDIPADLVEIPEGAEGKGVVAHGTAPARTDHGLQGLNDFTRAFEGDPANKGDYAGWSGPCPPWNDEMIHRYTFHLYALDVPTLGLSGRFFGTDVRAAIEGHVIAEASFTGLYWVNPAISPPVAPQ